mmetsp:Transcript_2799/g.5085  ORF Transcript_2799/g.5085 Transcript_2799/m.5085 type:complete len:104 (+) Transcript_2799:64-375(+)|eukprot:CAMPEP_0114424092 /NCGR_PEP_ID=MMETSP0103-20121206/6506_1 /TAXON_ID=37642 ORGANISM="Paraphysomonas imperforata, Strain PA2" /NCGR_SAMPLE_ID=MMETSP0103 /ASSEMBLY_ACC=CAM_ASM_000201 /LENGTH=103 /DNA_ID=CAMNT_0001592815 /DNA_START=47 /DNA_END=358 /DNA_ORIENTATION=+
MFASRVIQRVAARVPQAKKFSAAAPIRDGVFREKSFGETWLGDKGAYPVMSISVLGAIACTTFGLFYLMTSPDARLATGGSRSRMFRADIAQDYIKEDVDVCK